MRGRDPTAPEAAGGALWRSDEDGPNSIRSVSQRPSAAALPANASEAPALGEEEEAKTTPAAAGVVSLCG